MSPRGFYAKESIHPHFTTSEYMASEEYKNELATMDKIERFISNLYKYPQKIARRVWIWILFRLGHLKDLSK